MCVRKVTIGVFDSGIGGLTVLENVYKVFPDAVFYYYGDNARAPYGNLAREKILSYVSEAVDELLAVGVDIIVLACNTATTVCLKELQHKLPIPILGICPPVCASARAKAHTLVLATRATCESAFMKNQVKEALKLLLK